MDGCGLIEFDGLLVCRDRGVNLILGFEAQAKIVLRLYILRISREHFLERRDRQVELILLITDPAEVVASLSVVWIHLQRELEVVRGVVVIFEQDIVEGGDGQVVRVRRLQLSRLREQAQRFLRLVLAEGNVSEQISCVVRPWMRLCIALQYDCRVIELLEIDQRLAAIQQGIGLSRIVLLARVESRGGFCPESLVKHLHGVAAGRALRGNLKRMKDHNHYKCNKSSAEV